MYVIIFPCPLPFLIFETTCLALRTWKTWKHDMKKHILVSGFAAEAAVVFSKHLKDRGLKSRYTNVAEAREALEPIGISEYQHWQLACLPDSPQARDAYLWMDHFFSLVGDIAPNRENKVQLPGLYTQASIHSIFEHHMLTLYSANEHKPLDIRGFETLWKNVFPNVTISRYCQVSGKCFSCHALYERQEIFSCEADLEAIKKLSSVHKIMIEMQRGAYIGNRQLAQEYPYIYMSLIIDGMAQDHCVLPYYAGVAQENGVEISILCFVNTDA